MVDLLRPPSAFHFAVRIGLADIESFHEVEGIGAKMETESVEEGGKNGFIREMPRDCKPFCVNTHDG